MLNRGMLIATYIYILPDEVCIHKNKGSLYLEHLSNLREKIFLSQMRKKVKGVKNINSKKIVFRFVPEKVC